MFPTSLCIILKIVATIVFNENSMTSKCTALTLDRYSPKKKKQTIKFQDSQTFFSITRFKADNYRAVEMIPALTELA